MNKSILICEDFWIDSYCFTVDGICNHSICREIDQTEKRLSFSFFLYQSNPVMSVGIHHIQTLKKDKKN